MCFEWSGFKWKNSSFMTVYKWTVLLFKFEPSKILISGLDWLTLWTICFWHPGNKFLSFKTIDLMEIIINILFALQKSPQKLKMKSKLWSEKLFSALGSRSHGTPHTTRVFGKYHEINDFCVLSTGKQNENFGVMASVLGLESAVCWPYGYLKHAHQSSPN